MTQTDPSWSCSQVAGSGQRRRPTTSDDAVLGRDLGDFLCWCSLLLFFLCLTHIFCSFHLDCMTGLTGVLSVLNRPGFRRVERSFSIPLALSAAGCSSPFSCPSRIKTDPTECVPFPLPKWHQSEHFRLLLVCKDR